MDNAKAPKRSDFDPSTKLGFDPRGHSPSATSAAATLSTPTGETNRIPAPQQQQQSSRSPHQQQSPKTKTTSIHKRVVGAQKPTVRGKNQAKKTTTANNLCALDEAPPVVLKRNSDRVPVHHQTPQHITTLVAPTSATGLAAPLLILHGKAQQPQQYFVWGLDDGKIGVWTNDQILPGVARLASVPPAFVLKTSASSPWVQMVEVPASFASSAAHDDDKQGDSVENDATISKVARILALTSDGTFILLQLVTKTTTEGDNKKLRQPSVQLEIIEIWQTDQAGTTCFCVTQSRCIVVGYLNGQVQGWRRNGKHVLLWSGHFEAYPTIRSITQISLLENESSNNISSHNHDQENEMSSSDIEAKEKEYIIMTLEPKEQQQVTTASTVEVLCLTSILEAYLNQDGDSISSPNMELTGTPKSTLSNLALEDFWLLPEPGSELVDSSTLRESYRAEVDHRFATHWIPSHGTHVATPLPCTGREGQVLVELADGSIIFLGTNNQQTTQQLRWGVQDKNGQFLLGFPSVGRGMVTVEENRHVACSLRGGTVYLFPVDKELRQIIKSCHYPDDISTDSPFQHLQAFVAGDLKLPRWPAGMMSDAVPMISSVPSFPLLFFCWPGGIVDVYCAHLLPSACRHTEELAALVKNGTANDLFRLLSCLSQSDPDKILDDPLWSKACLEIESRATSTKDAPNITVIELESGKVPYFRMLLLQLADPSYKALPSLG